VAVSLLALGSVAVSGVSATAAPAAPSSGEQRTEARSVETDAVSVERSETRLERRLQGSHRDEQDVDGDIHLDTDFQIGGGGVGADPAFSPRVGGGGFAQASASASAFASAHVRAGGRSHAGGHRR
jgi:hypothetical protein